MFGLVYNIFNMIHSKQTTLSPEVLVRAFKVTVVTSAAAPHHDQWVFAVDALYS